MVASHAEHGQDRCHRLLGVAALLRAETARPRTLHRPYGQTTKEGVRE